ncbi:hypothetical protein Afil01_31740 [Actinorhabdospora filicis]|uniref:PemK-like, MazF-like toxin of type II toxin-antitoxin system n=1 Tax=Actinorhabdospora filicis TaxID=1785913 RepID=A0A9W6W3P0_9ACTN|nr:type II toxin-antitoxin system PemK/MazF family toxin [Actinorhabdospora filicis]GLZ78367.1 hypothetical protein Afil01_31740 [Actinorhabdospora filicis]
MFSRFSETAGVVGAVLALAAVVLGVLWVSGNSRRSHLLPHPPDPTWADRPAPGEIWWARVAFRDGTGYKDRPCLIIRTHADHVVALPVTSRDYGYDARYQEIYQTRDWDKRAKSNSYVKLTERVDLTSEDVLRRAGVCSRRTWAVVQERHKTGWVVDVVRRPRRSVRSPFKP